MSLVAITLGAIGYIATDNAFRVEAYLWVVAWFIMFATDVVYIKYIIDTGAPHPYDAIRSLRIQHPVASRTTLPRIFWTLWVLA